MHSSAAHVVHAAAIAGCILIRIGCVINHGRMFQKKYSHIPVINTAAASCCTIPADRAIVNTGSIIIQNTAAVAGIAICRVISTDLAADNIERILVDNAAAHIIFDRAAFKFNDSPHNFDAVIDIVMDISPHQFHYD